MLGLDPDPSALWPEAQRRRGRRRWRAAPAARAAAARPRPLPRGDRRRRRPRCVAVKPQVACFERLGAPGWRALAATIEHARAAGLLVLADGKRGDIDVTATAYAQALVGGHADRRSATSPASAPTR